MPCVLLPPEGQEHGLKDFLEVLPQGTQPSQVLGNVSL